MKDTIKINVPVLARVEGEGALDLTITHKQITELKLRIFEPPRYFEKFLQGRNYYDVPDTVARICGICPVAYQMSASHAIESIFGISISPWIRAMRRLFYCGEWLQSHSLHIHLLAAPDFFGFNSAIEMSQQYPDEVRRGLKLQALGNDLISLFGARSVHPVGVKIGGFTRAPDQSDVDDLLIRIKDSKQDAIDLICWLDSLELPEDEQEFVSVALHHEKEYPLNEGRLISDNGLDIDISEFENHFKEQQVDYSTALHCLLNGKPYLVGPLARINLNKQQLPEQIKELMHQLKAQFPSKNMFHSIIARGIEIYFTILEAEQLLSHYEKTDSPYMQVKPQQGTGYGCTEAPRGILWHRYDMDKNGCVEKAVIIPPTSQNQSRIEQDLKNALLQFGLDKPKPELQLHAEKVIRNYDPCISCATHFLDLNLKREGFNEHSIKTLVLAPAFTKVNLHKAAIIGIGSPNNGDELAFRAIDILKKTPEISNLIKQGLTLYKLDRPGLRLGEHILKFNHVLMIDAIKPGSTNKDFSWVDINSLNTLTNKFSSHQLALAESIAWIKSETKLPEDTALLAIAKINGDLIAKLVLSCLQQPK